MSNEYWQERYEYLFIWWRHFARRWEPVAFILLALLAVAFWPLPQWMVRHEYWEWKSHPEQYAKLVDDYRKTLVQIIGGAFLLYTLYLTQRRTRATEKTLLTTQESLKITRETQVTDRFTKAITQLGATDSQGKKQLEIRFGGIYSLERIARDSPDDHWPIMEILTAYVRENAPYVELAGDGEEPSMHPLAKDIQAAMTVIGRRKWEQDKWPLDLSSTDLRSVDLSGAYLKQANFVQAHLEHANFSEARLEEAKFLDAHMQGAFLGRAFMENAMLDYAQLEQAKLLKTHLNGASMTGAHLQRAQFTGAFLRGAFLMGAHLQKANLSRAHLEDAVLAEAHLEGADFSKARLVQTQLDDAHGDRTTRLPLGLTHPKKWLEDMMSEDSKASGHGPDYNVSGE